MNKLINEIKKYITILGKAIIGKAHKELETAFHYIDQLEEEQVHLLDIIDSLEEKAVKTVKKAKAKK